MTSWSYTHIVYFMKIQVVCSATAVNYNCKMFVWVASQKGKAGNPNWRRRISTVDLLVLTSLDQLLKLYFSFFYKTIFLDQLLKLYFFTKQFMFTRRSTVFSFPLQQGVHGQSLAVSVFVKNSTGSLPLDQIWQVCKLKLLIQRYLKGHLHWPSLTGNHQQNWSRKRTWNCQLNCFWRHLQSCP